MKRTFLLAALLLLTCCASTTTRSPLARFPWIDAARFPPPVLAWKCEPGVRLSDGSVYCHPDPDQQPTMSPAANLVASGDQATALDCARDARLDSPCAKHCHDVTGVPMGCVATCELIQGIDRRGECPPQVPPGVPPR
jgi:hypothetical protein